MKRLVQISSFIGLLLGLMISVEAQISKTYDIKIPFDFSIGQDSYEAGNYRVTLTENQLQLRNQKNNKAKVVLIAPAAEGNQTEAPRFSFVQIGGKNVLAEITGSGFNAKLEKQPLAGSNYAVQASPPAAH